MSGPTNFEVSMQVHDQMTLLEFSGDLDASSAHRFKEMVDLATAHVPKRLVLMLRRLRNASSLLVRGFICAKHRMGEAGEIFVVGAQESVLHTLMLTGFDRSVVLLDELPEPFPPK